MTESRAQRALNEARAHADQQRYAYEEAIRNDRIALAHWTNAGVANSLIEALQEHLAINRERLAFWEAFLNTYDEEKFFKST